MAIEIQAYAKINLHLDVTALREDGYHDLITVMQSLSLCDKVTVELFEAVGESEILIECDDKRAPLDERNIAHKAARAFLEALDRKSGVKIKIQKNIPMSAGLAGGSADGAATLVALNKLFGEPFSLNKLCELGASLGADVPFCIVCGCAYSEERGDKPRALPSLPEESLFVIACGGEGVSTPMAYSLLDEKYDSFLNYSPRNTDKLIDCIKKNNCAEICEHLFNIFEEPVSQHREVISIVRNELLRCGAKAAMMSGSGPSVFAIFDSLDNAESAVAAIGKMGYFATVAHPVPRRIF